MMLYLTFLSFGIPIFIFSLYGIIILIFNKNDRVEEEQSKSIQFHPSVTVVVPTHNEESFISKKIDNLTNTDFPKEKLEILFVDDSKDSTHSIIKQYATRCPFIKLVHFNKRKGYSPSMIEGCKRAKGEIIVLTDAGSLHDEKTISNLTRHFINQEVGGVTGKAVILNIKEEIGKSETLYIKLAHAIRTAETNLDSTFRFSGEACAVRKNLIADIEQCNASFDTAIAFHVRQKGYKTIYDPYSKFYDFTPKTHRERIKQKTIRAANVIKVFLTYKHMLFRTRFGCFGFIILPMSIALLVFTPILLLTGLTSLTILTLLNFNLLAKTLWIIILISLIIALIFFKNVLFTFFEFTYSILKALSQVIFTKKSHDMIEKIESTRR